MSCDAAGRETRASRMRGCGPEGQLKGDACRAACVSRVERGGLALRAAHVTIAHLFLARPCVAVWMECEGLDLERSTSTKI